MLFEFIQCSYVALGLFESDIALYVVVSAMAFRVAGVPNQMGLVSHVAYEPDLPLVGLFKEGMFRCVNKLEVSPVGGEFTSEEVIPSDGVLLLAEEDVRVVGNGGGCRDGGIKVGIEGIKDRVRWVSTKGMIGRCVGQMGVKGADKRDSGRGVVVRIVQDGREIEDEGCRCRNRHRKSRGG